MKKSAKDESCPLPVNCETPSAKNKEQLVPDKANIIFEDRIIFLEEKMCLLNTELSTLRSSITETFSVI